MGESAGERIGSKRVSMLPFLLVIITHDETLCAQLLRLLLLMLLLHLVLLLSCHRGDDRSLYPEGMLWLERSHIMGRVRGFLPYIGRITILFNDFPALKYAMIAVLGFFVLTSKE